MNKIKIDFNGKIFSNDQEAWYYIEGYYRALTGNDLRNYDDYDDVEFVEPLNIENITFKNMKQWFFTQE